MEACPYEVTALWKPEASDTGALESAQYKKAMFKKRSKPYTIVLYQISDKLVSQAGKSHESAGWQEQSLINLVQNTI